MIVKNGVVLTGKGGRWIEKNGRVVTGCGCITQKRFDIHSFPTGVVQGCNCIVSTAQSPGKSNICTSGRYVKYGSIGMLFNTKCTVSGTTRRLTTWTNRRYILQDVSCDGKGTTTTRPCPTNSLSIGQVDTVTITVDVKRNSILIWSDTNVG